MADYTVQATWSTKDALATGQALKAISATELGTEFTAIANAILSKYDVGDLASQAEAEALANPSKLLTPDTLNDVLVDNAGILKDLQALASPGADRVFGWDNSAGAAIAFTLGTGLSYSGAFINLEAGLIAISALAKTDSNFIVGNGSTWVLETAATARTSLGLGTMATQANTAVNIDGGTINGITDLAVADGGTGASTASAARGTLGLAIGTNVQAWDTHLDSIAALAVTNSGFIVGNGTTFVLETGDTLRTSLGLAIGTNVQAWDTHLDSIAALAVTNSGFIVGNGTTFVLETGATLRTSLGLGTTNTVHFDTIDLGHATDTELTRDGAGQMAVAGRPVFVNNNAALVSSKVFYATTDATGGVAGDLWIKYTA